MSGDPEIMPAETILEMATIHGAKALGLDEETGSLTPGKRADFIIIDLDKPHIYPLVNPVSALVYAAHSSDVTDVYIDGKQIVSDGQVLTLDEEKILYTVGKRAPEILKNTTATLLTKWPLY